MYPASAAVVIHNTIDNTQRFFLEHDDDVMSLAVHPKANIVASGQVSERTSEARENNKLSPLRLLVVRENNKCDSEQPL